MVVWWVGCGDADAVFVAGFWNQRCDLTKMLLSRVLSQSRSTEAPVMYMSDYISLLGYTEESREQGNDQ
jgi:hypothetical protein